MARLTDLPGRERVWSARRSQALTQESMKPLALAVFLAVPSIAAAQPSHADSQACERFVASPARQQDARARLQAMTPAGSGMAAFGSGCMAAAAGQWGDAAKAFERATRAYPGSAVSHYWLGRTYAIEVVQASILRQPGLARRTKAHLEKAVALDPAFIDGRFALMQYYLRAPGIAGGSVEKARAQVAEIRRRNAYRGGQSAATVARRQKDHAAAIAEYERLIAQYPDSAAPYSSLASTYGDRKQWDDAFRTIDRFLAAQPREVLAQYAIGRVAAESGQQLERGEQALRRYIAEASPGPGEPSVATAHMRLGAIHERRGHKDVARVEYQTALRLEPTLEAARDALAKLK